MLKFNLVISLEIGRPHSLNITNGNSIPATWQRLRNLVRRRDNSECRYCGIYAPDGHLDHVVPISRGGTDAIDNLVWACPSCNASKGNKTMDEWPVEPQLEEQQIPIDMNKEDAQHILAIPGWPDVWLADGALAGNWQVEIGRRLNVPNAGSYRRRILAVGEAIENIQIAVQKDQNET